MILNINQCPFCFVHNQLLLRGSKRAKMSIIQVIVLLFGHKEKMADKSLKKEIYKQYEYGRVLSTLSGEDQD